jgi:peptidoglycan hydrolase-like protein with peptidoglycan-binding domain
MEILAYAHSYAAYEEAAGIEYDLPKLNLNWAKLPSSAWLSLLGVAVLFGSMNMVAPASAAQYFVNTRGSCLNARTGPGTVYPSAICVRNGAALKNVVRFEHGWAQLSSGRWVAAQFISTAPGSGSTPGNVGGPLLRPGARNQAVRDVQIALRLPVDGVYGPNTAAAVRRFQANNGLLVDGIVGPQTRRALFR